MLESYLQGLSVGLVNLVNVLQPEIICLGGGVSNAEDDLLLNPLRELVRRAPMTSMRLSGWSGPRWATMPAWWAPPCCVIWYRDIRRSGAELPPPAAQSDQQARPWFQTESGPGLNISRSFSPAESSGFSILFFRKVCYNYKIDITKSHRRSLWIR